MPKETSNSRWKDQLHEIIYEADSPEGKLFNIILLIVILASILLVVLESFESFDQKYHQLINISEWVITIVFTLEYIARIICVKQPLRYITSFYGIIDLLSTIPKYVSLIFPGTQLLVALRTIRLLRVFRILKMVKFLGASKQLTTALIASRAKIAVFLFAVFIIATIFGTIMYLIEGRINGFDNIPKSIYWCIVTITTVGYGNIAPVTPLGQFIASVLMIVGYGIIAVPTGIVSAEYSRYIDKTSDNTTNELPTKAELAEHHGVELNSQCCINCLTQDHKDEAKYCYNCGHPLHIKDT